jgi:hypothetical protein
LNTGTRTKFFFKLDNMKRTFAQTNSATGRRHTHRLFVLAVAVLAFTFHSCFAQDKTNSAGEALLDDYITATTPKTARDASESKIRASLDALEKRVQGLQNETPREFLERYRRLLDVTRATIAQKQDEEMRAKVLDFIKATTGAEPNQKEMIPAAADACITEVSRLRALLRK